MKEENDVRKGIILAIGGLAITGVALLAGCGSQGDKTPGIPVGPKWKGLPYRISLDAPPAKPNPSGITIPAVKYTANPEELERRASLVIHFDTSGAKKTGPIMDQMIMGATDIKGTDGSLSDDYMALVDKGLGNIFGAYCMKGKIKLNIALARSSLSPQAAESEVNAKRLSDWLPLEVDFKNPHPKC
jgi:hypothetical protein